MIAGDKQRLRRQIAAWEAAQSPDDLRRSDEALFHRFLSLPQVQASGTVLLFRGMGAEPDTLPLIETLSAEGKQVVLPRCLPHGGLELRRYLGEERLCRHRFGMLEPDGDCPTVEAEHIDLALIPAVCYDCTRLRLGRGGGFYDRFLPRFPGLSVGLCREALLQQRLPAEDHDCRVDVVLTETLTIR